MNLRQYLSATLACALMCACGLFGLTVNAAEKPAYLKSATYFGDEWPINYWNSEDDKIDANLARIAADGFNSIILIVPWREFQPMTMEEPFNERAFARLDEVMDRAWAHGLWVTLRLGYSWDYYGPASLPERFRNVFFEGNHDRGMWLDYSRRVYETVSRHENFGGAFITWEDFWDLSYMMGQDIPLTTRIRRAKECGYTDYLREKYTLEEVGSRYGQTFGDFSEVYVPYRNNPAATLFYEYYDQMLMDLLADTQTVFPGLSMEVRTDGDLVYDAQGQPYYYSHRATFPVPGASCPAMMYTVSMGQANNGNRITAAEALAAMSQHMLNLTLQSGNRYYMEQFLFVDSTASVAKNTKLEDDEVIPFLLNVAPILNVYTTGYGIWAYRNYVNNCLYNAQFALGTDGWDFSNGGRTAERNGSQMALLPKNGSLSQNTENRMQYGETINVQFYAEPAESDSAYISVQVGNAVKKVRAIGAGTYSAELPWTDNYNLTLSTDHSVYLDNIRMYTYVQEGRLYEVNGKELPAAEAVRYLNSQLTGAAPAVTAPVEAAETEPAPVEAAEAEPAAGQ